MGIDKEIGSGTPVGDALPLPERQLCAGDRFPNFLLPDQRGDGRWFLERARGYPIFVFVDPVDEDLRQLAATEAFERAGFDCIAIAGEPEAALKERTARLGISFPLLGDSAGKIREALRQRTGIASPTPFALLLDANQRVLDLRATDDLVAWSLEHVRTAPAASPGTGSADRIGSVAPVLIVPNVLSPALCHALIARWETHGHEEGSVHSIVGGVEVTRVHETYKRRLDHRITDEAVLKPLVGLIGRRLAPELDKAFCFSKFRFDRFIVTCYDAERGDRFRRHRDNLSPSTADRRFALTINLNTDAYEGGELAFPEYGPQLYCVPAGGAILFSCSLLHEALPVTRGRRFTLLSFLRN